METNDTGHGTHVAGTIAAMNNNGIGVCGIAGGDRTNSGVKIMSYQVFSRDYSVNLDAQGPEPSNMLPIMALLFLQL